MRTNLATDCYEYVRRTYGVPAYVGVRVRIGGVEGVLVLAHTALHYVHVRFDGQKFAVPYHPEEVEYLNVQATE